MTTHSAAARQQKDFALDSTLTVKGTCWQKPGTAGEQFYALVLSKEPKTVGECIEWAAALEQPLKAQQVQGHLKWAYTSASGCLEVDGQRWGDEEDWTGVIEEDGTVKEIRDPAQPVAEPKAKKAKKKPTEPKAKKAKVKAEPTEQSATNG